MITKMYLIPGKKDENGNITPNADLSKAISWIADYDSTSNKFLITATFLSKDDCKNLEEYEVDINTK